MALRTPGHAAVYCDLVVYLAFTYIMYMTKQPGNHHVESAIFSLVRSGHDYTVRQLAILYVCSYGQPVTVRALAEQLNIAKPAVTRAVDKLVKRHMVARKEDPDDRRSVLIAWTKHGRDFLCAIK